MPYEPTNWKSGDVVTSAKLNKIEAGIASGGVLVATDTEGTLDKTWQEIWDAGAGFIVFSAQEGEKTIEPIRTIRVIGGAYIVVNGSQEEYATNSADGYPVYNEG